MKKDEFIFDKDVPSKLKKTQEWFASIITMPIDQDSRMNPISPSGSFMEEEAFDYIVPSPSLKPDQRIQIYNQQYWWRLFSILQDGFPLLARLFGYHDFNQIIAQPYLVKYPPTSWSLTILGNDLPRWVKEEYLADDKELVWDAARLDDAFNAAFFTTHHASISQASETAEKLSTKKLRLQPHIHLFNFRYDLLNFRNEMLKEEVEHWVDHDFPKLIQDKTYYFIVYRTAHNNFNWESLSKAAYELLLLFQNGSTIEQACEWLEQQEESLFEEAASKLHLWFQEWTFRQWLYIDE